MSSQSQVLSILSKRTNRFVRWLLQMELLKGTRLAKELQNDEHKLYKRTLSRCRQFPLKQFYIERYHFSPSKQTLATTATANDKSYGVIIDVDNGHVLRTMSNSCFTLLTSDYSALYVKCDELKRPYQLWLSKLNDSCNDQLVFENHCQSCHLNVAISRDSSYVIATSSSRLSSEVHIMPIDMTTPPYLVKPAEQGLFYFMEHAHNRFYILTNYDNLGQYKVMVASNELSSHWQPYYTPDSDKFIVQDMELFEDFVVFYGTTPDLTPAVLIKTEADKKFIKIKEFSHVENLPNKFNSKSFQIVKSSAISPPQLEKITIKHHKTKPDSGFKTKFVMIKTSALANDGAKIPITLFYDPLKLAMNGRNPLLVRAYGSHGISLYTGYNGTLMPLLRRGWILAYCHIRGGGELGKQWHLQATKENKVLSFTDLLSCISMLQSCGYSSPNLTATWGTSSGALSVSMACNYKPDLMAAVILEMPLVNLCDTLASTEHYINLMDSEEFGHTMGKLSEEDIVTSLCPLHNIREQDYPSFFITASTVDTLISYVGVCQYVTKLQNSIEKFKKSQGNLSLTKEGSFVATLPRGTVVFQKETQFGHWANFNEIYNIKQALNRILFLTQAIDMH